MHNIYIEMENSSLLVKSILIFLTLTDYSISLQIRKKHFLVTTSYNYYTTIMDP